MLGGEDGSDLPFNFNDFDAKKKGKSSENLNKSKETVVSERELNPILRKQSEEENSDQKVKKPAAHSIEWTTVLVKRAIAMIESGEKSFESAAIDRFGSIEAFEDAIRQVERYKRTKFNIRIPSVAKTTVSRTNLPENKYNESKPQVTPEDLNKLMAKKMKAELAGDFEAARTLEEQIKVIQSGNSAKPKDVLTLLPTETYNKRKAEKDMTIAELVRHEKLSNSKEFDSEMEKGITRNKRFKDDLDSLDDQANRMLVNSDNTASSNTFDCRAQSIEEYKQKEKITKECWFCPQSDRFKVERASDWIVAYGNYTYLALPKHRSIHPWHCLIVPMSHVCSLLDCRGEFEDEIWEEVRNFKKCLLQMAARQDRSFVFMECVMKSGDPRRHTFIDCVPTPRGQHSEHVKGHFLKALQETEEEWSNNKKVIDTSLKAGGLRSALPRRHFPYFYVDFRLDQGYAHVIEDAERFGTGDFGRDIMASILGVPRNEWRSQRTSSKEMKSFCEAFEPFNWTKQLRE